jgi:protease-4
MNITSGNPLTQKQLFRRNAQFIGVLEVQGILLDSKKTLEEIDGLSENPLIKGVLVRINSPGGAVAPSQEIYEALKKLSKKKPVFSSLANVAASGGYYVACGTKKIFANPGSITGSIGVIMQFADLSKFYQWAKIQPYHIKSGKFKDVGSTMREMTADEREILQKMADTVLLQFQKVVADSRQIPLEKLKDIADGKIYSGEQAKEVKLVDELGGFQDTVDALAKEAGISGKPKLIYAKKKKKLLELLLEEDAEVDSLLNVPNLIKKILFSGILGNFKGSGFHREEMKLLFLMPYGQ